MIWREGISHHVLLYLHSDDIHLVLERVDTLLTDHLNDNIVLVGDFNAN